MRWWDRTLSWVNRRPGSAAGITLLGLGAVAGLLYGARRVFALKPTQITPRLIHFAPDAEPAVTGEIGHLVEQVLELDNPDRSEAIERLSRFGSELEPVVPRLVSALEDRNQELDIRFAALTLLGWVGPPAYAAKDTLLGILRNLREPVFLRVKALEIVNILVDEDPDLTGRIMERLVDSREPLLVRLKAGQCLGNRSVRLPEWDDVIRGMMQKEESAELITMAKRLVGRSDS